ncbi:MAG: sodium:solute symporter [Bacteroidales bacterium]|nr:sodium/solute symporter [Bacteroidales bacterium]MBP5420069.1 sodium:solute symporter [Bacteroidales bacterium]
MHWIDLFIVIISLVLALAVGLRFARRQRTTDTYFKAGGRIPSWAVGMSMFATIISSVTFLAYPGSAYGGNWILLVQGLMVPLVLVAIIGFVIPLFRRVIHLSTYEYFELRFGSFARIYSSVAFIFNHLSRSGTILYLLGLAIATFFAEADVRMIITVVGFVVIFMTFLGGMEAIVWMDVVQGVLLIVGGIITIVMIFIGAEGDMLPMIADAIKSDKIGFGPYDFDLCRLTFWVMAFNGIFYAVQMYGTDQSMVQRYLTASTDAKAKRATYLGIFLSIPTWALFMFIGTSLYLFYTSGQGELPSDISSDAVFPYFIATQMPVGVTGLVIAALVAGAISSLDSDINCISAIVVQDFYKKLRPLANDRRQLRIGRMSAIVVGLLSVIIALVYVQSSSQGTLSTLFALYAIFSAGIIGMFLLGIFSRRANWQGLYIGIAASVLFSAYAVLTTTHTANGNLLLDLGEYNFPHHQYMLGVYSHIIVLVVGYIASLFFPKQNINSRLLYRRKKRSQSAQ